MLLLCDAGNQCRDGNVKKNARTTSVDDVYAIVKTRRSSSCRHYECIGSFCPGAQQTRFQLPEVCFTFLSKHLGHRHRSEEHTSELQSRENLVCRLLLEKKK